MTHADTLETIMAERTSVRAFLPDPVADDLLDRAFAMAAQAPSNYNTQPWTVCLASGNTRQRLEDALVAAFDAEGFSPDIPFLMDGYTPLMREWMARHLVAQQAAFGVARDATEERRELLLRNFRFFGAPHVAFFFMPAFGNEREAADVAMFAQSVMLALTALGLASCPQTSVGLMAAPVRTVLGVGDEVKLLFALSIGYEDRTAKVARLAQDRLLVSGFLTRFA
jgi:nitroreductase